MRRGYEEFCKKLHELREWDVPVERQRVNEIHNANRGLILTQTGSVVENALFATKSGRLESIISLGIENASDRDVRILDIQLGFPFYCADFHWLARSEETAADQQYVLPAMGPFPLGASAVLNARLAQKFVLCSGLSVEGLLLGEASTMVSTEHQHGSAIPIELTVFANEGRKFVSWMKLRVERQDQRPANLSSRRRLFDPDVRSARCARDECL
jgi:hypothetical protein